jgi:hypothetical protein
MVKYFVLAAAFTASICAAQNPMNSYKLLLNSQENTDVVKEKLFDQILSDLSTNLDRNISKLNGLSDQEVVEHFGKMNVESNLENKKVAPETLRKTLAKKMIERSRMFARDIYSKVQEQSITELKSSLGKTLELDATMQKEAGEQVAQIQAENPENAPAAPGYYRNCYNYYGYNYMYDYTRYYRNAYPYSNTYRYYTPNYYNGYYSYSYNYYPRTYYTNYYYPRYNRTSRLLTTGVFGMAAVGSFVDWLLQ